MVLPHYATSERPCNVLLHPLFCIISCLSLEEHTLVACQRGRYICKVLTSIRVTEGYIDAGQIGYALAPMIARGAMLGPDQPVILHLLDIPPAAQALEGVRMEIVDAAFPLVKGTRRTQQQRDPSRVQERKPVSYCPY